MFRGRRDRHERHVQHGRVVRTSAIGIRGGLRAGRSGRWISGWDPALIFRYHLQRNVVSLGSSSSSPLTTIIEPTWSPSSTYESDPVDPADAVFNLYLASFLPVPRLLHPCQTCEPPFVVIELSPVSFRFDDKKMFRVELGCRFKVTRRFSRKHERCTISGLQILRCDLCLRATGGIWILLFNLQLFFVLMLLLNIMCEAMNPAAQKLRSTRATVIEAKLKVPARISPQL